MGPRLISFAIAWCVFADLQAVAYYDDGDDQPRFDPEAHGLPTSVESDVISWNDIFAEEYRDAIEREKRAKPSYMDEYEEVFSGRFEVVPDWPKQKLRLGQVGGLATDDEGVLHILHRASRVWNFGSFDEQNAYRDHNGTLIKEPTILLVNTSDGRIVDEWGSNQFVLPHGLEVDGKGNLFATDVALHQVFMFEKGSRTPALVLGKAFKPAANNDDDSKFCKPSDVAVASDGSFFVSDGYCASRIMKFDKKGKLMTKFGVGDSTIPHGLALAEDLDYLCVADREGMRVLCYKAGITNAKEAGEPVAQFTDDKIGRVFGITYSPPDGLLYGIIGQTGMLKSQGFSVDLRDNPAYKTDVIAYWSPDNEGFSSPHAIALSQDGEMIFVGEIGPNNVWKFEKDF